MRLSPPQKKWQKWSVKLLSLLTSGIVEAQTNIALGRPVSSWDATWSASCLSREDLTFWNSFF